MNARRRHGWPLIAALTLSTAGLLTSVSADEPSDLNEPARSAPAPAPASKPTRVAPRPTTKPVAKPYAKEAAPAADPTSKSAKELSADEMLNQMLKTPKGPGTRPLTPLPEVSSGGPDKRSGKGAVAPAAPVVSVLREGSFLIDRVGRLTRNADGSQAEFSFEADGTSLQDPPMVIIPNLKLQQMEDATTNAIRDLRFRVSGTVTEYRGRNYILLEKVVMVPEVLDRF